MALDRRLLLLAASALLSAPLLRAQGALAQPSKLKRVGWIGAGTGNTKEEEALGEAFVGRLRELGWAEGQTIEFLKRSATGNAQGVEGIARELTRQKVDLIFAPFGPHAMAAHKVSGSIPLVFAITSDPVQ